MTNNEIPNDDGNPNDETQMIRFVNDRGFGRPSSSFGFRQSFVIGYFGISHFICLLRAGR